MKISAALPLDAPCHPVNRSRRLITKWPVMYEQTHAVQAQGRINHSGAPYQRKAGALSRTRSQDFLICGGALFSKKKLTTFFSRRYV